MVGYTVGFVARLIVLEMLLVFLYFFNSSNKIARVVIVCFGIAAALAIIGVVIYIFAAPNIATRLNGKLDVQDIVPTEVVLLIFGPNLALACCCLLASGALCAFFAHAFLVKRGKESGEIVEAGLKRAFIVAIAMVITAMMMTAISIAELPVFGLYSQILFLGIGKSKREKFCCSFIGLDRCDCDGRDFWNLLGKFDFEQLVHEYEDGERG